MLRSTVDKTKHRSLASRFLRDLCKPMHAIGLEKPYHTHTGTYEIIRRTTNDLNEDIMVCSRVFQLIWRWSQVSESSTMDRTHHPRKSASSWLSKSTVWFSETFTESLVPAKSPRALLCSWNVLCVVAGLGPGETSMLVRRGRIVKHRPEVIIRDCQRALTRLITYNFHQHRN